MSHKMLRLFIVKVSVLGYFPLLITQHICIFYVIFWDFHWYFGFYVDFLVCTIFLKN